MAPDDHREWRKSSYSGTSDNSCVEVRWHKSSYSGGGNDSCVEVAFADQAVGVRDSKNVGGPVLGFSETAWRAFAAGL
jgi:hypothetical protein